MSFAGALQPLAGLADEDESVNAVVLRGTRARAMLDVARRPVERYVEHYNNIRLNSAPDGQQDRSTTRRRAGHSIQIWSKPPISRLDRELGGRPYIGIRQLLRSEPSGCRTRFDDLVLPRVLSDTPLTQVPDVTHL
jgi:hypothetical protein